MALPSFEVPVVATPPARRGLRIPGVALIRTTHGLQRGMLLTGIFIVAAFLLVAVFAPLIAPYGYAEILTPQQPMSAEHLLGTTVGGYDVFSRIVWGARTALQVILLAVALSIVIGVPLGLVSGYLGSWLDRVLVLAMDALYAFPSLLLAIVVSIMLAGGSSGALYGILSAAISITVVFVPQYFRVTRNATIAAKVEPYVDAARVAGANPGRIMFGHILPNVSQSVPVLMTLNASEAILTLAGLGFLGFGIEPNSAAEWGFDLNKARADVSNGIWWTGVFPGLAIVLIVVGITLIGESLNDVLNPLLRTRGGDAAADELEVAEVAEDEMAEAARIDCPASPASAGPGSSPASASSPSPSGPPGPGAPAAPGGSPDGPPDAVRPASQADSTSPAQPDPPGASNEDGEAR